jgi:membrane-bound acyltransferase YfiQ involved in biofilm formation
MKDLMKKFNMVELKPVSTLMSMATTLDPDENGEVVDQREYKGMIDSLLYLTMTWLDIQFAVCLCACFQASLRSSHRQSFSGFSGTSNTHSNLGFVIPLLHLLILLAFSMLILWVVGLIEKALLVDIIFLDLLLFVGLLTNNLLLHNPPQRLSMLAIAPKFFG